MAIAQKITALPTLAAAAADDVLAIVDDPAGGADTKKIVASEINLSLTRTPAEISAGVTPTDLRYPEGHIRRYGENSIPGTTDMTTAINNAHSVGVPTQFEAERYAVASDLTFISTPQWFGRGMPDNAAMIGGTPKGTMIEFAAGKTLTIDGSAGSQITKIRFVELGIIADNTTQVLKMDYVNNSDAFDQVYLKQDGTGNGLDVDSVWTTAYKSLFIRGDQTAAVGSRTGTGLLFRNLQAGGGEIHLDHITMRDWGKIGEIGGDTNATGKLMSALLLSNPQITKGDDGLEIGAGIQGLTVDTPYMEDITDGTGGGKGIKVWEGAKSVTIVEAFAIGCDVSISIGKSGGGTSGQAVAIKILGGQLTDVISKGVEIFAGSLTSEIEVKGVSFNPKTNGVGDAISLENAAHNGVYLRYNEFPTSGNQFANDITNPLRANVIADQDREIIRKLSIDANVETISTAKTLTAIDPKQQFLDASGADRLVKMPPEVDAKGMIFEIWNVGTAGFALNVNEDAGSTLLIKLFDGDGTKLSCDGAAWRIEKILPVTTTVDLDDVTANINTNAAKVDGYAVINLNTGIMVFAAGNTDASIWQFGGTGNTAHTPV